MASPVKPMLAISNTGASGRPVQDLRALVLDRGWVVDVKLDGIRAIVDVDGRIYNRRGADITYKFPEISNPTGYVLDGEIVAQDGTFESTLLRESQANRGHIQRLAETKPCVFVAFDLPLVDAVYTVRRFALRSLATTHGLPATPTSQSTDFIEQVFMAGAEGVVIKRAASKYQPGKRSGDWIKWKATRRISCIASGYSPGNGSRAHFGALHLALIKGDEVVSVGRTGSGFTERQTHELKARLDRGEFLVVEIEYLSFTGNALRFPVFRGVRTDVAIAECVWSQLDA